MFGRCRLERLNAYIDRDFPNCCRQKVVCRLTTPKIGGGHAARQTSCTSCLPQNIPTDLIHPPHAQILNLIHRPRTALRLPIIRPEDTNLSALPPHPQHLILPQPSCRSPRSPIPRPGRDNTDSAFAEFLVVVLLAAILIAEKKAAHARCVAYRYGVAFVEDEDEERVGVNFLRDFGKGYAVFFEGFYRGDVAG